MTPGGICAWTDSLELPRRIDRLDRPLYPNLIPGLVLFLGGTFFGQNIRGLQPFVPRGGTTTGIFVAHGYSVNQITADENAIRLHVFVGRCSAQPEPPGLPGTRRLGCAAKNGAAPRAGEPRWFCRSSSPRYGRVDFPIPVWLHERVND